MLCLLQHRMADACAADSNLRLKRTIFYFCSSCFPKKHRGNFNKHGKLENLQNLHVKQKKILQEGKLRHRLVKSVQLLKRELEGLKKTKKTKTVVYKESPSHETWIFLWSKNYRWKICLSRYISVKSVTFNKPDFSGPLHQKSFPIHLTRGKGSFWQAWNSHAWHILTPTPTV